MSSKIFKLTLTFILISQVTFSQLGKNINYIRKGEKGIYVKELVNNNNTLYYFKSHATKLDGGKCDQIVIYHINKKTYLCDMITYTTCSAAANSYAKDLNKIAVQIESNIWKDYGNNSIYKLEIDGNIVILEHYKEFKTNSTSTRLSEGAKLLFKDVKSNLKIQEMNEIYKETGFYLSSNKTSFLMYSDDSDEDSFGAYVNIVNLNKDNIEEVFISYGNTYTSGITGNNIALYVKKGSNDKYSQIFDLTTGTFKVLHNRTNNFYDLMLVGRGYEHPIWKWNGSKYFLSHRVKE